MTAPSHAMSAAEVYERYKRTALAEHLRFFLQCRMSDALRLRAQSITRPRSRDLAILRTAWRTERAAEERAAGVPAIGTAEWHRQCADPPAAGEAPTPDADLAITADTLADAVGVSA